MRHSHAVWVSMSMLLIANTAYATGPAMTPLPKPATAGACAAWATNQDEEAIYMWSTQEDGSHPKGVGVQRLADSCLGKSVPDIVYFGSSVGFDDIYCAKHRAAKICHHVDLPKKTNGSDIRLNPSDRYAGCIFSIAIPLMHQQLSRIKAEAFADGKCEKYSKGLDETEMEGIGDYVSMILDKVEAH